MVLEGRMTPWLPFSQTGNIVSLECNCSRGRNDSLVCSLPGLAPHNQGSRGRNDSLVPNSPTQETLSLWSAIVLEGGMTPWSPILPNRKLCLSRVP